MVESNHLHLESSLRLLRLDVVSLVVVESNHLPPEVDANELEDEEKNM